MFPTGLKSSAGRYRGATESCKVTVVDSLTSSVRVAVTSTWPFAPSGAAGSSRTTRVVELD
ncbi:MAG: hypothetical protein CXX81_04005 [Methanobacteriota archaeon]|nr:MAG: hypothetical protein CXX81_24505 [Euryarchaeota archaeon]PXY76040.1 MAG: hypothetical protein CXX81_16465 [Euryarchaeota archaeon]PXY78152.1 MAG: hypothetical protein CXX81_09265 [Euryarchaeota archaeon]PXY79144.1 MAG: hypothetical protein CXX81_04005 [Euryarchaeota archaeon]